MATLQEPITATTQCYQSIDNTILIALGRQLVSTTKLNHTHRAQVTRNHDTAAEYTVPTTVLSTPPRLHLGRQAA